MARTLQFEQESLPAETGRQARALGQALQALADGLNAAAAGGARARGVLQSLPATVQAAARPLQTALNPALGALGALVRGAADGTDRLAALLGGQTAPAAKTAARAVEQVGRAAKTTARSADKAARSLAGFDEIERLAAADAADTALPDAGGTGGGSGGAPPRCSPDQENMPLAVDSLQFEHAGSTSSAAALLRGSLLWLALYCFLWDAFL